MPTIAPPVISDKPEDVMNGSFPPSLPDSPQNLEVLTFNVQEKDLLTFTIEGSDFFHITGATVSVLRLVKSPFELPNHVAVFEWKEGTPRALDISSPVAVRQDQRVHVSVTAGDSSKVAEPGAFAGTLVVSGQSVSFSVPLNGTLVGVDVKTPIGEKYASLGGAAFLGEVVGNTQSAPEGNGTIQEFTNGALWDTGQGVFYISRAIYDKWTSASVQAGPGHAGETAVHTLGTPTEDTLPTAEGGAVLRFQGGSITVLTGQAPLVIFSDLILTVALDLVHVRDTIVINNDLNDYIQKNPGGTIRLIARQIVHDNGVALNAAGRDVVIIADEYDSRGGIIDTRQAVGATGNPGSKGQTGTATSSGAGNKPGGPGGIGGVGGKGLTAASVRLICQRIVSAHVVANGSTGGTGGVGGEGGQGGAGRKHGNLDPEISEGTSGGDGGQGGRGGQGGSGGHAVAIFIDSLVTPVLEVGGGPGGAGGRGGQRGVKGANSPDDTSKPGPIGAAGAVGPVGTASNLQVDEDAYWGSVQAELGGSVQEWADYRVAVGSWYFRAFNPDDGSGRQDYLLRAVQEFEVALRLDPQNSEALRLKRQILLNQNILGLDRELDLLPQFEAYITEFTSFGSLVFGQLNAAVTLLIGAANLNALAGQVNLQVGETNITITKTRGDLKDAQTAAGAAAEELQQAEASVTEVTGQIRAALADMSEHNITFGNVLGVVAGIGGAVLSIAAAIPSGGTSLAALVPDVMALSDSLSDDGGIVDAIFDPETSADPGSNINTITNAFQKLNQDGQAAIQNTSVVNFVDLIDNLDHATTDNPEYRTLLQRGVQVMHEQYLAERRKAQADQAVTAISARLTSLMMLLQQTQDLLKQLTFDQTIVNRAGLNLIQNAQCRLDSLLGFAFLAQRSLEIYLPKTVVRSMPLDAGYLHPDIDRDFAEKRLSNTQLLAAYTESWTNLQKPIDLQTAFTNFFTQTTLELASRRLSFTAAATLQTFRDTHDLSFSFPLENLPADHFEAKVQTVFVSFVGAKSQSGVISCVVRHSGCYEQLGPDGTRIVQQLKPKMQNTTAGTTRLQLAPADFNAADPPLIAPRSLVFWGRGVAGIWGVSIPDSEFQLDPPDLTNLSEIQVWVGYQFSGQ